MGKTSSFFIVVLFLFYTAGCMTSAGTTSDKTTIGAQQMLSTGKQAVRNSNNDTTGLLYEIRMPAPHTHYLEINMTIEKPSGKYIDIAMPAWSPGRYIIYDFAKHIHHIEVFSKNGKTPLLERLDKQTWRITGYGRVPLTLTYSVYANTASGTFSHLSSEGALINGASVFMYPLQGKDVPITLAVHLPEGKNWTIATGLPEAGSNRFYADTYDHLIDSPLSIGDIRYYTFTSFEKPVRICFQSPGPDTECERRLAFHCKSLCDAAGTIFGELPFTGYTFLFYTGFSPGIYDGMEHMNSCCITDTRALSTNNHLKQMTALAAHELWHVWNIKCIRPQEFMSYNLAEETYTNSLWIIEGFTRYFQNVLQLRAGLITREKFRRNLASYITVYESKPGREEMTLEEASLLTWFDRGSYEDTNRINTRISYYNKGAVVGLLLDLTIRGLTAGRKGLEDVFKNMYRSYYKKGRGYTVDDFYAECEKAAGESFRPFFSQCVQNTGPLPYNRCAGMCGFILENRENRPVPDTGMVLDNTRIINIIPGSAAEKAGFQKFDELLLVNGNPFTGESGLPDITPGHTLDITFLRYGRQLTLPLSAGEKVPVFFLFREKALVPGETAEIREAFYTGNKP
jgi:predicted metalloprotease with PDZ domain